MPTRRAFLSWAAGAGALASIPAARAAPFGGPDAGGFAAEAERPVLRRALFDREVRIESIELLRNGKHWFVRTRSTDGVEGIAVSHGLKMSLFWPIFLKSVVPFYLGKDARDIEAIQAANYVHESNYKMQGQAYWVAVASLEFSLLDLLGKTAGLPVGALLGEIVRTEVAVYQASNRRGNPPEDEVERLAAHVKATGAKAAKIRLGGRMSNNADSLPGRTEALIPLARSVLGDTITLYGDANGSYDVPNGVRIGRMMEEYGYGFLEEPCPFDSYEETQSIADTLTIPVAGGECESSLRRFRWMIEHDTIQVVQPDLFYFGGLIRAIRVARMAAKAGKPCTIHISSGDLGFLYMLHFASCVPNCGPFQEFKGGTTIPVDQSAVLSSVDGVVRVPSGPGLGITIDPEFLARFRAVSVS